MPVTIKDLTHTKGIRTTWGSKVFEDYVPDEDSLIVERLKAAGAIVIGKTNTPEFGAGGNTFNAVFGVTRNPWNPALTCGGSSGGAARGAGDRHGPDRPGLRHRRIAAHAGGLLWRRRLQDEPGARAVLPEGARLGFDRGHGTHGPHRRRLRR